MSSMLDTTIGRAALLAGVTGLRAALGPALITASRRGPGREAMALAALGEMLFDKLPFTPSRSTLPALLPRVLAGYWVAKQVAEQDRSRDPSIPLVGAAAAGAAALLAPNIRAVLGSAFRLPDPAIGMLEDALAVYLGSQAAGLSPEDLSSLVADAFRDFREKGLDLSSLPIPGPFKHAIPGR